MEQPSEIATKYIANNKLVTIDLASTTAEAARLMQEHRVRRLPVMKNETLVGIITSKDLLACVQ